MIRARLGWVVAALIGAGATSGASALPPALGASVETLLDHALVKQWQLKRTRTASVPRVDAVPATAGAE
jgi:uncharacterized membrane protein